MGVEGYCTCTKDYGEKNFTLSNNNDDKKVTQKKKENNLKKSLKVYDNYFSNVNLINSNYFSINPTNHPPETTRKWQNCIFQKSSTEVFLGRVSDVSSYNNSINYTNPSLLNTNNNNNSMNLPMGDKYEGEIKNNKPNGKGIYYSITGEIREGIFIDGHLNGKGKMTLNNGFFVEGNFVNDE